MKKILLFMTMVFMLCGCNTNKNVKSEIKYDYSKAANVFVLAGQSNMEGQTLEKNLPGYLIENDLPTDYYKVGFEDIKLSFLGKNHYTNDISPINGEFVGTKLGYGASTQRFGPEIGIAETLHNNKKDGDSPIYLIKFAYSGAGFYGDDNFKSPSTEAPGTLWKRMVPFIHNCLELIAADGYLPIIKGLLWAQGEADGYSEKGAVNYERHMTLFLEDFMEEFKDYSYEFDGKNIAFIDSYISKDSIWAYCDLINRTKDNIAAMADNHYLINTLSDGLDLKLGDEEHGGGDAYHYTVDSMLRFGHEFARLIIVNNLLKF